MSTPPDDGDELVALPTPADVEPAWYETYLSAPRLALPAAAHRSLVLLLVTSAVVTAVALGSTPVVGAVIAAATVLTFGLLAYLGGPGQQIGIRLGPDTVSFGRRGSDLHHWPRSAVRSVTSHPPWHGEPLPAALASYVVPGHRYLTLTRTDGVVAHVSVDSASRYADLIEDVLVNGRPLPQLSHPPAADPAPRDTWSAEGADASVVPLAPGGPPPPTMSARPDGVSLPDGGRTHPDTGTAADTSAAARASAKGGTPGTGVGERGTTAGTPVGGATRPPSTAGREPDELLWRRATQRHDAVLLAYAPYEVDPHRVMRYPAMTDVTCPSTAAFVETLSDTAALRTDDYPGGTLSAAYRDAVARLEVAWSTAERYARRVELALLDAADRKRLQQARKLLAHAESAATDAERATYYGQVKALMDDLARRGAIVAPPAVRQAIAARVAHAITAGPPAKARPRTKRDAAAGEH